MSKYSYVELTDAGDFNGYLSGYFYPVDYSQKPNISGWNYEVVDAIDGMLLRHNLLNSRNNKIQNGFEQIAVWKLKTNKVYTDNNIVDTLILEDGTIYQTFCYGWYKGDKKAISISSANKFSDSFSSYNNNLPSDTD